MPHAVGALRLVPAPSPSLPPPVGVGQIVSPSIFVVGVERAVAVFARESSVEVGISSSVRVPNSTSLPVNVDVHEISVGPVCSPLE